MNLIIKKRFKRWILKKIFKDAVVQGPHHQENIIEIYSLLHDEFRKEFTEDSRITRQCFLLEQFDKSFKFGLHENVIKDFNKNKEK